MQRAQIAEQPSPTDDELTARFLRYLGDPTRVKILNLLLDGDKNVGELVESIGSAQGRVSSHLTWLRWCGYVYSRREGKHVYYGLQDPRIRRVLEACSPEP